jgi:hypothetical protein
VTERTVLGHSVRARVAGAVGDVAIPGVTREQIIDAIVRTVATLRAMRGGRP